MNFLLKDDRAGGSLEVGTGAYRAGDGEAWNAAGNVGLPLGDTGFANLSFEYGDAGPTDRSVQRADAAALAAAGNTAVADPAQPWGDPTSEDDLKLFGNFGYRSSRARFISTSRRPSPSPRRHPLGRRPERSTPTPTAWTCSRRASGCPTASSRRGASAGATTTRASATAGGDRGGRAGAGHS